MTVVNGISPPPRTEPVTPRRAWGALLMIGSGVLSLLVSMLFAGAAVMVIVSGALPNTNTALSGVFVTVFALFALFAAALGWLAIRAGRERLNSPRHGGYYPGY